MDNSIKNRRYYLHRLLRKKAIRYKAEIKTIFLPTNDEPIDKAVQELESNYKYQIQLEIPC